MTSNQCPRCGYKKGTKRSLTQNNYYWLYLGVIAIETGNIAEELHEFFKKQFLPRRYAKIKGPKGEIEIEIRKSTTELTKAEFGEYLDKICALVNVPLPDPAEAGYLPSYAHPAPWRRTTGEIQ